MDERQQAVADNLHRAWPLGGDFVTRSELTTELQNIELKIDNSEQRQRNWVLGGCLAIILAFGGGYVSLVSKLDRLSRSMPIIEEVLEGRRMWMERKDQRDDRQDRVLQTLEPKYQPLPYVEAPK